MPNLTTLMVIKTAFAGEKLRVITPVDNVASKLPSSPLLVAIPYSVLKTFVPSWNRLISVICTLEPSTICTKYLADL